MFAVYFHLGGRQTRAGAEVGWQGDQIRPRNQGWEDGDGENTWHTQLDGVGFKPLTVAREDKSRHACHCSYIYNLQSSYVKQFDLPCCANVPDR